MGLKKNFFYSTVLTTSNYIFPLLVFPYVSRVLGVSNIGICSFIDNLINYFITFSMLGISGLGIREVSSNKSNHQELNKIFSNLIVLNGIFTIVFFVLLLICTQFIDKLHTYDKLIYIGAIKLLFNFLLVEWLYTGLEEFKYITIRTLIVKTLYIISVFLLVKQPSDYVIYFILTTLIVVINAIINIVRSRKIVHFKPNFLKLSTYLKPYVILGVYMVLTSIYTTFNIVYLGFMSSDKEVGYFSTAYKLLIIFLSIYTAWSNVAMPRMSELFTNKKEDEYKKLIEQSFSALLCFSMPIIILGMLFSPDIIYIISGTGFEKSGMLLRLLFPLLFIIGYSQIMIMQILIPLKEDKALLILALIGAVVGTIINILFTPALNSVGSCMAWISAEFLIMITAQQIIRKKINRSFPFKLFTKNLIAYIPAIIIYMLFSLNFKQSPFVRLFCSTLFMIGYFIFIQYHYLKNNFFLSKTNQLRKRFFHHR